MLQDAYPLFNSWKFLTKNAWYQFFEADPMCLNTQAPTLTLRFSCLFFSVSHSSIQPLAGKFPLSHLEQGIPQWWKTISWPLDQNLLGWRTFPSSASGTWYMVSLTQWALWVHPLLSHQLYFVAGEHVAPHAFGPILSLHVTDFGSPPWVFMLPQLRKSYFLILLSVCCVLVPYPNSSKGAESSQEGEIERQRLVLSMADLQWENVL